jgi:hypothetical protein
MPPNAYRLTQPLTAERPSRWDIQARCAMRIPAESVQLPAGTWLLVLPPADSDYPHAPHYRLADGRVVAIPEPLTPELAVPLTDPQALAALAAFRPLEQALAEDWGLQFEPVDASPPFHLLQCPLCGGTRFTTVAFTTVWCDDCNVQLTVRHTAGDPGWVCDVTNWSYLAYRTSRYLLPRSDDLVLTMVCKNGGDLLDLTHSDQCHRPDCSAEQLALTKAEPGPLRGGLHACALGDVYDWSFYGCAPTHPREAGTELHTVVWPDGRTDSWPDTAYVTVSGLDWSEQARLAETITLLKEAQPPRDSGSDHWRRWRDERAAFLQELAARPAVAPRLRYRSPWPQRQHLATGEKYLLHHWLLDWEENGRQVTAAPVWLVVIDAATEKHSYRWQVVRDNICPACGQMVSAAECAAQLSEERPWRTPHYNCRDLWARHKWGSRLFNHVVA